MLQLGGQKRRFCAVFLCMALIFTMLPNNTLVLASETGEDTTVVDNSMNEEDMILLADNLTDGNYDTTFEEGAFIIKATKEKKVTVDGSTKTADDGTSFTKRLKLNGSGNIDARSIHFTTTGSAIVTVYAMSSSSSSERKLALYNLNGTQLGTVPAYGTNLAVGTFNLSDAGDYYLASPSSGVNVYGIKVSGGGGQDEVERPDWNTVNPPVISEVVQNGKKIHVTFELITGNDGADKATVVQMDLKGNTIDSILLGKDPSKTVRTAEFTPVKSGIYRFKVIAERIDETTAKESSVSQDISFILPLEPPTIKGAYNVGNGRVSLSWDPVTEAEGYAVSYKEEGTSDFVSGTLVTGTETLIEGLRVGVTYLFSVKAVRENEESLASQTALTVTEKAERPWFFTAYGPSTNTDNNYYIKNKETGAVTVASENGKGKLQPASTDGLAYYYTKIAPDSENFVLSAKVTVDSWTFSNGQEGFGLMASDAVGQYGDRLAFWNNSFMLGAMKVEYYWDEEKQEVSDSGNKIVMKQGLGAQEKVGVTAENIADGTIVTNINELFHSTLTTLESSCAKKGAGTYNVIGNYNNAQAPTGTVDPSKLKTTFLFTLQRDNTGYRLSYKDKTGNTTTKLFYDLNRNALTQIDKENIYVGFFASRNAKITVTDIALTTSDPATDPPAQEHEITYVTPSYRVISPKTSAVENHQLTFIANADGVLTIRDSKNKEIVSNQSITAGTYINNSVDLTKGINTFHVTFTPDADYKPSKYEKLSSYETVSFEHSVEYKNYSRNVLYVAPDGTPDGTGAKNAPLDVYTAVQYVKPGQVILLKGGMYSLYKTILIDRGIDGTADKKIYFLADEKSTERPVFNFNSASAGMIIAGDYWYLRGFDVTKSADAAKGIQLSGNHCMIDSVNTYYNGNTGLQISRYLTSDLFKDWPSDNLILNCSSYGNSDKGYEDADGFAAKLTVGTGNAFDGCIAYNNADDGWDLFAKVETGFIGQVVIKNCVTYGNGYLPDGTNAGNGNGFKLGGSSITGYHKLMNSIAYNNKAKGIDSNSCPDIQVYQCTAFNNEAYNVAFYTNDAANTDFFAEGVLSYRTSDKTIGENIKPKGSQDTSKIFGTTNYYWEAAKEASFNSANDKVSEAWFTSLDTTTQVTRNSDGTINMNGLLELTDSVPTGTGARMSGTPSLNIEIPGEDITPIPVPTSAPVDKGEDSALLDSKIIKPELDNGKELSLTLVKDKKGSVLWEETITFIKDKLKEYQLGESSNQIKDSINYKITLKMNQETVIPKELLEAVQGRPILINLVLDNGLMWGIKGKDIEKDAIKSTDLAVKWKEGSIPNKVRENFMKSAKGAKEQQLSLVHDGAFGFMATLTIDFGKFMKGEFTSQEAAYKYPIAGIYYYNPATGTLTLQSSSKIGDDGIGSFTFNHASDYVILLGKELVVNEDTLKQITVNGVKNDVDAKSILYVGGTEDKTKQLIIKLPDSIQEAINKGLMSNKMGYMSDDITVAEISDKGLVTAKGCGNTVVTVNLFLNDITLRYKTKVTVEKARIIFVKPVDTLKVKEQAVFKVKVFGFKEKDLVWMTTKKNISIVHKNAGKTKALVYGTSEGMEDIYIKLLLDDGEKIAVKTKITVIQINKTKEHGKKINEKKGATSVNNVTTAGKVFYLVKEGDNLWKIARTYHITVAEILANNDIKNPDFIRTGQKIKLPMN